MFTPSNFADQQQQQSVNSPTQVGFSSRRDHVLAQPKEWPTIRNPTNDYQSPQFLQQQQQLVKIVFYGGRKISAYIDYCNGIWASLDKTIKKSIFDDRKQPTEEIRIYWIDAVNDEIDIVNQNDYTIFLRKCSDENNRVLHVAPIKKTNEEKEATETSAPKVEKTSTNAEKDAPKATTPIDPANFIIHDNVECDSCGVLPMVGFRYKCIMCPNYDLCERCEAQHKHSEHMMVRMPTNKCPNVIETWISERSSRRKGQRVNFAGVCPFNNPSEETGNSDATADTAANSSSKNPDKGEHRRHHHRHERKQRRQSMRSGIFTNLFEMMHNLAEGGVPNIDKASNNETASAEQKKKPTVGIHSASDEAAAVAEEMTRQMKINHDIAKTVNATAAAAEANIKALVAANAAIAAAKATATAPPPQPFAGFSKVCAAEANGDDATVVPPPKAFDLINFAAPQTAPQDENVEKSVPKGAVPKTPPPTPNVNSTKPELKQTQSQDSLEIIPFLPSPTLENLAQIVDPQYMKAGIQILNNFSEMFAKMLDPTDNSGIANNIPTTQNNAMETSSSSESENANENVTQVAINENVPSSVASSTPSSSATPNRRRSQSVDGDWQILERQLNIDDLTNTNSSNNESIGAAAAISSTQIPPAEPNKKYIDFAQVSQDLKDFVELENERERAVQQQPYKNSNAQIPQPLELPPIPQFDNQLPSNTQADQIPPTAPPQFAQIPPPPQVVANEEKRAIPVYHPNPRINKAVQAMMAMGFSNEGGCLTHLVEAVNGNIPDALDLMNMSQQQRDKAINNRRNIY